MRICPFAYHVGLSFFFFLLIAYPQQILDTKEHKIDQWELTAEGAQPKGTIDQKREREEKDMWVAFSMLSAVARTV